MIKQLFAVVLLTTIFFSCKTDKTSPDGQENGKSTNVLSKKLDGSLPDACTLVSQETLKRLLGVSEVTLKDGSGGTPPPHNRSCFFKWEDSAIQDAGILVQVSTNPIQDEAPEYLAMYIDTKRKDGEIDTNGKAYPYQDFKMGTDGVYCFPFHKYLWRMGYDYSFMIAFNANFSEEQELAIATEIANEVMATFNKL